MEMTKPLTPREKVRKAIIDVMKPKDADITLGRIDTCADAILTALASGSGDHAELARLARIWSDTSVTNHKMPGGTAVVWSRRLEALLAEIAALRGERDGLKNRVSCLERLGGEQSTRVMQQATRAKEAERKLAEAVGLFKQIEEHHGIECIPDNEIQAAIRALLSKEAERDKL